MKKWSLIGLFIVFVLVVYLNTNDNQVKKYADLNISLPGQELPDVNYSFKAKTDTLPAYSKVYRIKKQTVTVNDVQELAKKFNINGSIKYSDSTKEFLITDNDLYLTVDSNNFFSYINKAKLHNIDLEKNIPNDDETINIAKSYLINLGLLPDRFNNIKIAYSTTGSEISRDLRIVSKDIYFYPTIDNKQVYGISRIIVSVGHNGEIEAVNKYYQDFEFFEDVKLKSVNVAIDELQNGKASNNIYSKASTAIVNNIIVGYYEDPSQEYLQPVYVFVGETSVDGKIHKFDAIVPAIEGVSIGYSENSKMDYTSSKKPLAE